MNVSPLQTHENKIGSQMITPGSLIKEREVQKYAVVCLAYQKRKVTWLSYKYHRLQIDKVHKQHCWGVGGGRGCCMIKNEMSDRQVGMKSQVIGDSESSSKPCTRVREVSDEQKLI